MIALVEPVTAELADVGALAALHGWALRRCAPLAAIAAAADDLLLHAADLPATAETNRLLFAATAPVVAVASAAWIAEQDWRRHGYVAAVDRHRLATDLPIVVAEWSHAARLATIDRLVTTFGDAPVAGLLRGLREMLRAALRTREPVRLAAEAHRIAGLAGTLGFAALGRHWQHVADRDPLVSEATRRATVHALATLDRAERGGVFTLS